MRAVLKRVGVNLVPVLAVALSDGSHFVCSGDVVSPEQFARDYQESESVDGSLSVATPVASDAPAKPKRKRS